MRGTLVRLEDSAGDTVAHTHDEVVAEVNDGTEDVAMRGLGLVMRQGFDWSDGLPIMSEETSGYYYSKAEA